MEDGSAAAMDPDGAGSVDLSICRGSADWARCRLARMQRPEKTTGILRLTWRLCDSATVTGRAVQLMFKCSNHSTSSTVSTCLNLNKYQRYQIPVAFSMISMLSCK